MKRIIAYVDGFNLYHAISDIGKPNPRRPDAAAAPRPYLKWVNLWSLCQGFANDGRLDEVNYFSAYATWLAPAHRRHIEYVKALEHVGVKCIMGHFKDNSRCCKNCGKRWIEHEEKETDVHIAARIVVDACMNRFDKAILISADSDLAPALNIVRMRFPEKQLLVVAPPNRFSHARSLRPSIAITAGRLEQNLLPAMATRSDGRLIFKRPSTYDPPLPRP